LIICKLVGCHKQLSKECWSQGGHLPGEPGKPGKVREFKSVREKRKSQGKCVLAYG